MSVFITQFGSALFSGWNLTSFAAYSSCVLFTQVSGAMYYGTVFGTTFMKLAYPNIKTEEDKKRLLQDFNPTLAYGSAFGGAAVAFWLLKTLFHVFQVSSAIDGASIALLIVAIDTAFGIMHPFFEDRPFKLYLLHRGYHAWCLGIGGAVLGAFL